MEPSGRLLIPLNQTNLCHDALVGGKAAALSRLIGAGFRAPRGFCLTVHAYEAFVRENGISQAIGMEIGRKPLEQMRWEEMWDAALRIRSRFLASPVSAALQEEIGAALRDLTLRWPLVARSSARGEDSAERSFAGLHESFTGVKNDEALFDAIRLVWASLWSDAALLYRRELELDPSTSRMAVLIQETALADRSGVAFGRDPRPGMHERAVIEAVPGACRLLVDGLVDPDRWQVDRKSRETLVWEAGSRPGESNSQPLLEDGDVDAVVNALFDIEELFGWPPDMEWTGRSAALTILQARPITTPVPEEDERSWYLTLRPGQERLRLLRERVADQLIPELASVGERFASEDPHTFDDRRLAEALEERRDALAKWKRIYWDEFIPFAHGVRALATYYNDAVRPEDPYEFVGLLADQEMIATKRNRALGELAGVLSGNDALHAELVRAIGPENEKFVWEDVRRRVMTQGGGAEWLSAFETILKKYMDVVYSKSRMADGVEHLLRNVSALATAPERSLSRVRPSAKKLESSLLEAVGASRHEEAGNVIETGRLSWRLRDDDNILLGRIESQLLKAIDVAFERLQRAGRLVARRRPTTEDIEPLARGLRNRRSRVELEATESEGGPADDASDRGGKPRQLIGQPASPGLASGRVRRIRGPEDLGSFQVGEVLVCDAIQPGFTHVVPLAGAVVERRGGMLIHGAIIAREIGIPCVNGVRSAVDLLHDGDLVTVDGHVGIVTVGPPEFDAERLAGMQISE